MATGPHLHFEVIDANGNKIDPLSLLPERPSTITVDKTSVIEDPKTGSLKNK